MNIVERLITTKPQIGAAYDDVLKQLGSAELLLADNVLDYYWETSLAKPNWKWSDYPNLAPPFREFFVGFNRWPQTADIQNNPFWKTARGGVYFSARDITETQDPTYIDLLGQNNLNRAALKREGVKWVLYGTPLRYHQDRFFPAAQRYVFTIKEDGSVGSLLPMSILYDVNLLEYTANYHNATLEAVVDGEKHVNDQFMVPALITLSMLHCRNVVTLDNSATLGKVGKKPKLLRKGAPTTSGQIKFKTLRIEPVLKRVLETEGRIGEQGLLQALHTCRGHFKDYRHGAGLFGRHKEIYWWDAHERGNEEAGIIVKDYVVDVPPGGTSHTDLVSPVSPDPLDTA